MGMSNADIVYTTTNISQSLNLFYVIGGTILVCLAAIWGFGMIKNLLNPEAEWSKRGYSSQSDMDDSKAYFAECDRQVVRSERAQKFSSERRVKY